MTITAPARAADRIGGPGGAIPPSRDCSTCGRRDAWRKARSGGWQCGRCAQLPAPPLDNHGLPELMRHACSKMGCDLAGEDEDGPAEAIAPSPPAAIIAVSGPSLLSCPGCRRWARVLLVATDGRLWCARCP